jgi:hypothetical protein
VAKIALGDAGQLKSNLGPNVEVRAVRPEVKTAADPVMPGKKP